MSISIEPATQLRSDLCSVLESLGKRGGILTPSVYETSRVITVYPTFSKPSPILDWIVAQQRMDGGWGYAKSIPARTPATLAATLALIMHGRSLFKRAINKGIEWLIATRDNWREYGVDDISIAGELIIPQLIEELESQGYALGDLQNLEFLFVLQRRKLEKLRAAKVSAGSPLLYSWETWGTTPFPSFIDSSGGIGGNAASTAAWIYKALCQNMDPASLPLKKTQEYLQNAAMATTERVRGVFPTAWPISGFELGYGIYALMATQLKIDSNLQRIIDNHLDTIERTSTENGFGWMPDSPDGDDTAVATGVLLQHNRSASLAPLMSFRSNESFCTYRGELNPSLIATTHALYCLSIAGSPTSSIREYVLSKKNTDGSWRADKWHSSWIYPTMEAVIALIHSGHVSGFETTARTLLSHQHGDGYWTTGNNPSTIETAFALLTLDYIAESQEAVGVEDLIEPHLRHGLRWLIQQYLNDNLKDSPRWIGKELYAPSRVDRVFTLAVLLRLTEKYGQR